MDMTFAREEKPMSDVTRYIETHSENPAYNLALEEYVLTHRTDGNYLMLWQNDNTIVIGQNQNAEAEINRAFVEKHGIHVVRRTTGGGAVYHDLGNLNYSFITDAAENDRMAQRFTAPVVRALRELGVEAEASGRNDILAEGKKVSGTAQRLTGGRILHHGTLLFDANPGMVAGALNADPLKFQSKSAKSVRSRIGNIRPMLKKDMTLREFWDYLKGALAAGGLEDAALTEEELAEVRRLKETKYDTWEWNFGASPRYGLENRRKWDGGILEVRLAVEQGHIAHVVFYGDFLALCPLDGLRQALCGVPFRREDVAAVLDRFPLERCFGGIAREEILDTIFDLRKIEKEEMK